MNVTHLKAGGAQFALRFCQTKALNSRNRCRRWSWGCGWSVAGACSGNGGSCGGRVDWHQEEGTQQKNRYPCHYGLHHRRGPLTSPQTKPQRQAEQKSGDDGEPGLPPRPGVRLRGRRFNGARVSCARRCGKGSAGPVVAIPVAHSLRIRWIGIPSRWGAVLAAHDRFRNARTGGWL